jgi:proline iminopeptidase
LALAYAERHPARVRALILRGIFLLRRSELEWFYQDGAHQLFPDAWEDYLAPIPRRERSDLIAAYYKRLTSRDARVRHRAARAWTLWEGRLSRLVTTPHQLARFAKPRFAAAFARIEAHYFAHGGFLRRDDQLLRDARRIQHIPGAIVQGRYDLVCPARSAWDLHRAWPRARFVMVPDAGHSMTEPGIQAALIRETARYA